MAFKVVSRFYDDGSHTVNGPIPCSEYLQNGCWDRGTHDEYVNVFETFTDAQYFIDTELTE